jgi:hypothetical protein
MRLAWAVPLSPAQSYAKLLEAAGYFYAIRLYAKRVLQGKIAHRFKRPVFEICSASEVTLNTALRPKTCVAASPYGIPVRCSPASVVTTLPMEPDWIIHLNNQRGTDEQHLLAHANISFKAMIKRKTVAACTRSNIALGI